MGQQQSPEHKELYRRVDEVLHYLWDPIGIRDVPEARDEYHSYLPHVFSLLTRDASAREITDYLASVTTEKMELPDTPDGREHHRKVTDILMRSRDVIHSRHAKTPNQSMERTADRCAPHS